MTIQLTVLLIMCIIPLLLAWLGGYYRQKQFGIVDNKTPRVQSTLLTGTGARVVAAQQNAWEALAVYIAALVAVSATTVSPDKTVTVCVLLLVARILHAVFYIINKDLLRSAAFLVGYGSCMYMFYLAFSAV